MGTRGANRESGDATAALPGGSSAGLGTPHGRRHPHPHHLLNAPPPPGGGGQGVWVGLGLIDRERSFFCMEGGSGLAWRLLADFFPTKQTTDSHPRTTKVLRLAWKHFFQDL